MTGLTALEQIWATLEVLYGPPAHQQETTHAILPHPNAQTVRQSILEQVAGVSLLLSRGERAAGAATIQAYHFLPPGFQHHVSLVREWGFHYLSLSLPGGCWCDWAAPRPDDTIQDYHLEVVVAIICRLLAHP